MGDKSEGKILDIKIADLKATAPHFHTHSSDLAKALTKLKATWRQPVHRGATTSRARSSTSSTART